MYASRNGHLDIVEFLLSKGVDMETEGSDANLTPLMMASGKGHVPIINSLLDKGANINHQNDANYTALHSAVLHNNLAVVKVLLERGADKSLRDKWKLTPLEIARNQERKSIENYLSSF